MLILLDFRRIISKTETNLLNIQIQIEQRFLRIAIIACDVLAILGIGISVKRVFSIARYQVRYNRNYCGKSFLALLIARTRQLSNYLDIIEAKDALRNVNYFYGNKVIIKYKERIDEVYSEISLDTISDVKDNKSLGGRLRTIIQKQLDKEKGPNQDTPTPRRSPRRTGPSTSIYSNIYDIEQISITLLKLVPLVLST